MRPSRTLDHIPLPEDDDPGSKGPLRVAGVVVLVGLIGLLSWSFGIGLGLILAVPLVIAIGWLLARS